MQVTKSTFVALITALVAMIMQPAAFAAPGLDTPVAVAPYLDGAFPQTSPGSAEGDWIQVDYYPGLTFVEPVRIIEHPVDDRLLIVQKDGTGWTVSHQAGATDKTLFFDISSIMHGKSDIGEGGISDLVFHPEFGLPQSSNSSYVYISYRWSPTQSGSFSSSPTVDGYDRVSRFSVINGQVALGTEQVLINQYDREQWHLGGDMFFGDDGFLYISKGDEGNCCNRLFNTQRLDGGLFSGILRIDVDQDSSRSHPIRRQPTHLEEDPTLNGPQWPQSFTQNYLIPNDNPFVDPSGNSLEEFYSIGLRHPWTVSRDPATGNIWVADVGQNTMEEINISRLGDNHQWGYAEGTVAGVIPRPANVIGNEAPPIWAYPRTEGQAVIGAGVYRGSKFPDLIGKYLFSDFISGNLWTAAANGSPGSIEKIGTVTAGFPNGVNSYLLDSKGDVLMARTAGGLAANGKIEMLTRAADVIPEQAPPFALSQTGAFSNLANLVPHAGCVPYDLNVPFWSDSALKSRWMCIPNDGNHNTSGEKIGFSELSDWSFPKGAVLIKHFELLTNTSNPSSAIKLETRFIVHAEDGYYGVTYRWNDSGTDSFLLTIGEDETYTVNTPSGSFQQTWRYPSRAECQTCHTEAAGGALGPNTRQLNGDTVYPITGQNANQLETLNTLGMFSPAIAQSELTGFLNSVLTSSPTHDQSHSLSDRARSYLDSNCSYCHMLGGVRANFDARLTTPLASQGLINGSLVESLGISNEAVIVPGSLTGSILFHRLASAGESFSMPPIAKSLVDEAAVDVISEWILSLDGTFQPPMGDVPVFVNGSFESPVVSAFSNFSNFNAISGWTITAGEVELDRTPWPASDGLQSMDLSGEVAGSIEQTLSGFVPGASYELLFDYGLHIGATTSRAANVLIGGSVANTITASTAMHVPNYQTARIPFVAPQSGQQTFGFSSLSSDSLGVVIDSVRIILTGTPGPGPGPQPGPQPEPGNEPVFANGSFESPVVSSFMSFSNPSAIPGWTITAGEVELDRTPWPASEGLQSMDLSSSVAGSLEQTLSGFVPGASYDLLVDYGLHGTAPTARTANVLIGGSVANTITAGTDMRVPNYQTARITFVAPQSGQQTFGFSSLSSDQLGVVIDNVRITLTDMQESGPPQSAQNVALNKVATQSSTSSGGQASRAVDGNTDGNFRAGSVTHTNGNSGAGTLNPWWRVDLGATFNVLDINIFNRTNCCSDRLNGATVYVGNVNSTNPSDYTAVGTLTGSSSVQTIAGASISGRYVMVRIGEGILSLAEVQVMSVGSAATSTQ